MLKNFIKLSLVLGAIVFSVSACSLFRQKKITPVLKPVVINTKSSASAVTKTVYTNKLKIFKNYSELTQFLSDNSNSARGSNYLNSSFSLLNKININQNIPNNYLGKAPAAALIDQEKSDIIKTDGNYTYTLTGNELSIIQIKPSAKVVVVSKIIFKSKPQAILLSGNFLAVYGNNTNLAQSVLYQTFKRKNIYTFLKIFDISNPTKPKLIRDLNFEGSYLNARLINNQLYFLTVISGIYLTNGSLIPRVLANGQILSPYCDGVAKCFAPKVYYFDIPYHFYNFVSVTAINLKDNATALSGQIYILNNKQKVYLTADNLYITYNLLPNYYDLERKVKRAMLYPELGTTSKNQIIKIKTIANFILNNNEKENKTAQIINRYLTSLGANKQKTWQATIASSTREKLKTLVRSKDKTLIYKFAIKNAQLIYRAFGQVNGAILNQSALNQNGDYLRLMTVTNPLVLNLNSAAPNYYSNIYILGPNLQVVGSLQNLLTTEKIYRARFIGNRLYLITLKSTDPLFIINLNDPTKPAVLGAVQIPGLVNYLQPLDLNGNKFAVLSRSGKVTYNDGTEDKGLTWSLFDLSDLSKPRELSSYLISDSTGYSNALKDHQALFYSPTKNLLSIPATLNDSSGHLNFVGALVFNINNNKFKLQGKIDHSAGGNFNQVYTEDGHRYHNNTLRRSLLVNNNLITFSNKFLKINSLTDLKPLANIELTSAGDDYIIKPVATTTSPTATTTSPIATTTHP